MNYDRPNIHLENSSRNKGYEVVNWCEFDTYAAKSYCAIHDETEEKNLGDITKVDENSLDPFNMICGGSPCQDFSVAGKQKGSVWTCKECGHEYNPLTVHWSERDECPECHSKKIDKTRSSLLVEYLRIIRGNKPNFGIYENVKNIVGKQFKETTFKLFTDELEEYGYNVHWKVLNAKDYGIPQNRERVYLLFIKKNLDNGKFKYPTPFDNGVRLKDVLEDDVDDKYYLSSDKVQKFISNIDIEKTLIGESYNGVKQVGNIVDTGNWGNPQRGRIYSSDGCSPALNCCGDGGLEPKIVCGIDKSINGTRFIDKANCITAREDRGVSNHKQEGTAVLEAKVMKVGNVNPSGNGMNGNVFSDDGLAPTLTTNKGEGNKILQIPRGFNKGGLHDICPTLSSHSWQCNNFVSENNVRIRKLTPKECFRLMGFSDCNYEAASTVVSNSQLYKQTGNSIVVDVLYYILVELYEAMPYLFDNLRLSSFFSGIGAFEIALDRLYESIKTGNFTKPQVE